MCLQKSKLHIAFSDIRRTANILTINSSPVSLSEVGLNVEIFYLKSEVFEKQPFY